MNSEDRQPPNKAALFAALLGVVAVVIVGAVSFSSRSTVDTESTAGAPAVVTERAEAPLVPTPPDSTISNDADIGEPPVAIPSLETGEPSPDADSDTETETSVPGEDTSATEPSAGSSVPLAETSTTTGAPASTTTQTSTDTTPGTTPQTTADTSNAGREPTEPAAEATATTQPSSPAPDSNIPPSTAPPASQVAGQQLFVDSTNSAAQWASNNSTDPRAAIIAAEIGSQPIARWFGDWNGNVGADVADYVNRASDAGAVPALVAYNIPDRDCGQHSSGGAANFDQYDAWISSFASGLGNSGALIILEPDALALNDCAGSDRNDAIADAVATIKASCGTCSVYLDAGHSNWVAPADMANRLLDAGVLAADGFFTNVSNYNATAPEQAFGAQVLNELGNPNGLAQVIDTSRNGNGANGEWCDAPGRAIGDDPSLNTGAANVDAFLWIKVPGEADGCIAGAGQFVPDRAFELANG